MEIRDRILELIERGLRVEEDTTGSQIDAEVLLAKYDAIMLLTKEAENDAKIVDRNDHGSRPPS